MGNGFPSPFRRKRRFPAANAMTSDLAFRRHCDRGNTRSTPSRYRTGTDAFRRHGDNKEGEWSENGKEERSFETYCDLIERELREALKGHCGDKGQPIRSQTILCACEGGSGECAILSARVETQPVRTGSIADDLDPESKLPADRMAEPAIGHSLGFPYTQPKRVFRLQNPTLGSVLICEV
jgi:hypothetical protein